MDAPGPGDPPEAPGTWANPLRRNFGTEDLEPQLSKNGIDKTIVVQTVSDQEETRELLALAERTPWLAGVIGWLDLTDPALTDVLAELTAAPNPLVGIRHQVHDEPDAQWLLRPDVMRGLRAVADAGLAYDLLIRTPHLEPALQAVRQIPHGVFVIDHIAKPDIAHGDTTRKEQSDAWFAGIGELAAEPNVACKLSGMVTEADWANWTVDDLLPYARHILSEFGPERVMFGSDWPVCTLAATYDQVAATVADLLARCGIAPGSSESESVFGHTAHRVYLAAQ
jgi:L-fuconolactonase